MLPEFGSQVFLLLFEPNDEILRNLAERYIIDDLARWEPRVRVTGVRTRTFDDENGLSILIDYEILAIALADAVTLVFRREGGGGAALGAGTGV
jgi:phage baseplate assembly protein W